MFYFFNIFNLWKFWPWVLFMGMINYWTPWIICKTLKLLIVIYAFKNKKGRSNYLCLTLMHYKVLVYMNKPHGKWQHPIQKCLYFFVLDWYNCNSSMFKGTFLLMIYISRNYILGIYNYNCCITRSILLPFARCWAFRYGTGDNECT